jgi:hypothetical protein
MTQEEKIRKHVDECIDSYADQCGEAFRLHAKWEREHIVNIGTSVLCTKWEVGYPGGSFVQAIVGNDLREAFGRADAVNQHCIKFYLMLMHNSSYIS